MRPPEGSVQNFNARAQGGRRKGARKKRKFATEADEVEEQRFEISDSEAETEEGTERKGDGLTR